MHKTWSTAAHAPLPTADAHRQRVGGILPGYAGHVPHAQSTFGAAHTGGINRSSWSHNAKQVSVKPEVHSLPLHSAPFTASRTEAAGRVEKQADYVRRLFRARGSIPGYTGHRGPGQRAAEERAAHDVIGTFHAEVVPYSEGHPSMMSSGAARAQRPSSARGTPRRSSKDREEARRIATAGQLIAQGKNIQTTVGAHNDWLVHAVTPPPPPPPSAHDARTACGYREQVGGILTTYAGHVPHAKDHYFSSHKGGVHEAGPKGHLYQRGHAGKSQPTEHSIMRAARSASDPGGRAARAPAGYRGHMAGNKHTWGISYHRGAQPDRRSPSEWVYEA